MTTTIGPGAALAADANVHLLAQTNLLLADHAVIRDRDARREDFVLRSARIIRRLLETALDLMPYEPYQVRTPIGAHYTGTRLSRPICAVSVMRAGDSMAEVLRTVDPSIRIGKILVQRDPTTKLPHRSYVALPDDLSDRHVLLLDPMLATGGTALTAIDTVRERGVPEEHIVFVNLITVASGVQVLHDRYPNVRLVTSAIDEQLNDDAYMVPGIGDFGDRFFGTDR